MPDTKEKNMKQLSRLLAFVTLCFIFLSGCASMSTVSDSAKEKQRLLTQAGFQLRNVTAQKQRQRLAQLPANRVSPVKYHGRIHYVYPMTVSNQMYVGNKAQCQSYLELLRKEQAQANAQANTAAKPRPVFTEEVPGPGAEPILIQEYDDWGPLLSTQ
jgi:hypothetical protein